VLAKALFALLLLLAFEEVLESAADVGILRREGLQLFVEDA
jgi:hypothetical protein